MVKPGVQNFSTTLGVTSQF